MAHKLLTLSTKLKQNLVPAKRIVWGYLRGGRIGGIRFQRKPVIDNFVVDFASFEKRLIIDIDHEQPVLDTAFKVKRDQRLEGRGFTVLRFWNREIVRNRQAVLATIKQSCS
jgi:very-short-patch-repair endonuclease